MSEEYENNYPTWITAMFDPPRRCSKCDGTLKIDQIVAVGLYTPNEVSDTAAGPMAGIEVRCDDCGQLLRITSDVDVDDIAAGTKAFYHLILEHRMDTEHKVWVRLPSPNFIEKNKVPKHNDAFGLREGRIKRVRRDAALQQMPSDKEVQVFLNKLRRTSFKRDSKSFKRFMTELCVDLDLPDKGGKS